MKTVAVHEYKRKKKWKEEQRRKNGGTGHWIA